MNERQQVVYIANGRKTVEQGPFTKIIWPSTQSPGYIYSWKMLDTVFTQLVVVSVKGLLTQSMAPYDAVCHTCVHVTEDVRRRSSKGTAYAPSTLTAIACVLRYEVREAILVTQREYAVLKHELTQEESHEPGPGMVGWTQSVTMLRRGNAQLLGANS